MHSISQQEKQGTGFTSGKIGVQMNSCFVSGNQNHPHHYYANQLGPLVRNSLTMMDRLFELENLNLHVAINIFYGMQLQPREVIPLPGLTEFRKQLKWTLCFALFIALRGLLCLTLDCFFHGHHPQKQPQDREIKTLLSTTSCGDASQRWGLS